MPDHVDDPRIEGNVCCILEVCCGGNASLAIEALTEKIVKETEFKKKDAEVIAKWIFTSFDLAPHGTIGDFKELIAKMARAYPYRDYVG